MKKIIAKISLIPFLLLPALSFAASDFTYSLKENTSATGIIPFLNSVKDWIMAFAGAIAVLFIVIGGFQLLTSSGNTARVETAKKTLTYAIVGVLVIILAQVVLGLINGSFLPSIFKNSVNNL